METRCNAGLALAILAALGLAARPAAAQTTGTFSDNFLNTGSANTSDINAAKGTPRQGGTVLITTPGGVTYAEPSTTAAGGGIDYDTQLDNTNLATATSPNLLIAAVNRDYSIDNYASPNVNLAPGPGGTQIITFGTIPNNDDWSGAVIGTQGTFVNGAGGIGFLLRNSGVANVFVNGTQIGGDFTVTGFSNTTYNTVVETYVNNGTAGKFSLVIDGTPIVTGIATPALTDNHVLLFTFGGGGQSYFNTLSISAVAAPEPSQTAALGLGVLALAGLALKARRRSATSA